MRDAVHARMRSRFLPFAAHAIGQEEIDEVVDTLRSAWITTGPKVKRFEGEFAPFVNAPAALAVSSCTAALHLALMALGVGPGDRVVTSPMTFCSSIHVIEHAGAQPIFVDIEPDTLNIDPARVEAALSNARSERTPGRGSMVPPDKGRVRAIMPVHLHGHPCDLDAIWTVARDHGAQVIEDAAHALGATYRGRAIGSGPGTDTGSTGASSWSLACFSFYATKNLTTAEGGMLVGPPEALDEARVWSLHGMSRDAWKRYSAHGSWYYEVVRPGFKYNMTDIQASIGIHQLHKFVRFQVRRREIARRYNAAFAPCEALQIPTERPEVTHAWHLYVLRLNVDRLRFPGGDTSPLAIRHRFIEELRARKIGTSVHFIPVHVQPYYRDKYGYHPEDFPNAYREYTRLVSLPIYPGMSDDDVDDVIEAVMDTIDRNRA